ncbi:DUF2213 domain-containing protein [Shinella sp. JR1-6]|uniref:DUF2213 domain-containing protein n=1 Tax=Shinella sp. JR1-6 TaxID=2527671 RepID=UPI001405240F|nr:DUF2213 domain-containing protein [Shinella sp. JR1-6]
MHLQDKLTIDDKRRTGDGYLVVNARVARADNVQLYTGAEVGKPEMATVRVFRPAAEVFSADTMKSFAHRPVTLGHPSSAVSSINWRDVAKGWSDGEVARDGDFIRVSMLLADEPTIKEIDAGTRELSMGYDCTLDWTPGKSPSGEAYDAIQRGIRSNHIAVVPQARGGSELRIGDSGRKDLKTMTDAEKQTMRDSVRGMPLAQAAALPIFDDVRGIWHQGMKAEEYFAITAGAVVDANELTGDAKASNDAYEKMVADMNTAYHERRALDGSTEKAADTGPKVARDGRPLSALTDRERAHEAYLDHCDSLNCWRSS